MICESQKDQVKSEKYNRFKIFQNQVTPVLYLISLKRIIVGECRDGNNIRGFKDCFRSQKLNFEGNEHLDQETII